MNELIILSSSELFTAISLETFQPNRSILLFADVCYICLKLERGDGLIAHFFDSVIDNEVCLNIRKGNVQIVCQQDLTIGGVMLSPSPPRFSRIYHNLDIPVNFTVNVTLQGQGFVPSDHHHFDLQLLLSDRETPDPLSLNNGQRIVLAGPEDFHFDTDSENGKH